MSNQLSKYIRYALAACSVSALAAPIVYAQSVPASPGQSAANTEQLGTIEVTGTRIKRTSVETAQPITIITAQQIRASGLTTVSDVLQNITQAGNSLTLQSEVHGGAGAGATNINLRYFGASRVLILVNGRRWTKGLGGTVDLSAIPSAIIDHIEVLQDGASAIYGSDAITGVVNIITVHNFDGAEAHAYTGIYDNDYGGKSGWDGKQQAYDFTVGTSGARSGVVMSLSYTNQDPVWNSNRAQSVEPIWTQGQGKYTSNSLGIFTIQSPALADADLGNATCSAKGVCTLAMKDVPANDPTLDNFVNARTNSYNSRMWDTFQVPTEAENIFINGHYDIADSLTFTSMASYSRRDGLDPLSPQLISFGTGGYYTENGKPWGIGKNNPYNPFGVDLVGNLSQYCPDGKTLGGVAVASCTPNYLLSSYQLWTPETGRRLYNSDVDTTTIRMGFNGFFNALGNEWDWDMGYSYGHVLDLESAAGLSNNVRVAMQLDSPGVEQCNGPAQASPGSAGTWTEVNGQYYQILTPNCVPLNPFGGYNAATGQGGITSAMAAYMSAQGLVRQEVTSRDYTADLTGTLANLPAGPLAVAVGAEYLEEDGFIQPSDIQASGNIDDVLFAVTSGRTWTQAEYFEFDIPMLSGVPMVQSLNLDIANRWSQFSWQGGDPGTVAAGEKHKANSTTGRAQLRWQPTTDLLLRGSWAQGFRAPSISNLYSGTTAGFPVLQDPCAPNNANGNWNPSTPLPAGCNGVVHSQPATTLRVAGGGNPNLQPETAISRSVGFVYSPNWLPGFDFGADYYKIELDNQIGSVGTTYIMQQCFVVNNPQYCSHIQMSGNILTQINNTTLNVGSEYSNGIDVNADYTFPSTSIGNFKAATSWTFVRSFMTSVPSSANPSGFQAIEYAGSAGYPKIKGSVTLNWSLANWSANWAIQYIGQQYERCSTTTIAMNECSEPTAVYTPLGTTGKNHLGTTIYHDVAATYHAGPINTDFTMGIRNLFNKQYPASLSATELSFVPGIGYRTPGRFIYARVGVKF